MYGSLAQLNRASDYGSEGYRIESCRSHLRRSIFGCENAPSLHFRPLFEDKLPYSTQTNDTLSWKISDYVQFLHFEIKVFSG